MKSFISGQRGKRLVALCLVILQVLFQFPVEWKAEGKVEEKDKEILFLFTDDHGSPVQGVQVELSIYKKGSEDEEERQETEDTLSSSLLDKEEKSSPSTSEKEETSSASNTWTERGKKYTKLQEYENLEKDDDFPHAKGEGSYPGYDKFENRLFYTGQPNAMGEIVQKLPSRYLTQDFAIFMKVRAYNDERQAFKDYYIEEGVIPRDLEGTVEITLDKKRKQTWDGTLAFDQIEEIVIRDKETYPLAVRAHYDPNVDEGKDDNDIEYYLVRPSSSEERIWNPGGIQINAVGIYTLIARIPGDENHKTLEVGQKFTVKETLSDKLIFKNGKNRMSENYEKDKYIDPINRENVKGTVLYEEISNADGAISIENSTKLRVKGTGTAVLKVKVKDGATFKGTETQLTIAISKGEQEDFAFDLKDFEALGVIEKEGQKFFQYKVNYGKENPSAVGNLGKHSFPLRTKGQKTNTSFQVVAGTEIAELQGKGILEFKNRKRGTVVVAATAENNATYKEKTIYAEINVVYPDYSDYLHIQEEANAKGWYNKNVRITAQNNGSKYAVSYSDSWEHGDWEPEINLGEDSESPEGKIVYIKTKEGIGLGLKEGKVLGKYKIDTTEPELSSISYTKDKESRLKSLGGYGFYRDTLEVELKAKDKTSKVDTFRYRYLHQDSDNIIRTGSWLKVSDGDENFSRPDENTAIAKIKIDPQFRGKIEYYAVDNADNNKLGTHTLINDEFLVVDSKKPEARLQFTDSYKRVGDHFYFQNQGILSLGVEETNFFTEDQDFSLKIYSKRNGESKESSYRVQGTKENLTLKKDSTFLTDGRTSLLEDNSASFIQYIQTGDRHDLTLNFEKEGHYRFSFAYRDPSGNPLVWKKVTAQDIALTKQGELAITVDHTDPKIFFDPSSESGQVRYFAKDVKLKANVLEENFNPAATDLSYIFTPDRVEGRTTVASSSSLSSGTGERSIRPNNISWKKEKASDSTLNKAELSLSEDGKYVVHLHTTDFSGRTASASNILVVDKTPPKIRLTLSNDGLANEKYFREVRKGQIEIEDAHLDFSSLQVDFSVKDKAGNPVSTARNYAAYLKNPESWTQEGNKYTCLVEFTEDGIYHLGLKVKDLAGNENAPIEVGDTKAAFDFVVDRKAPTGALKIGDWDRSKDGTLWTKLLDRISFGRFSNKKQVVRLQAEDNLSGVGLVEVLRTREKMSLADLQASSAFKNVTSEVKDGYWSKEISPNETFITYVHLKDMAGNQYYLSSDGVILDQQNPEIHITLPKEEEKNGLYKKDVGVGISVTEPSPGNSYAGLKDVTYTVYRDGIETQEGSLYHFSKEEPQLNDLKKSYDDAHALTILAKDNNSNDVLLKIKAVDNAGNQTVKEERLSIDITKPRVTLSFDNNRVENEFYFKENRTATITVEERNFSEDAFKILITDPAGGKDGRLLEVERDSFQKVSGSGDSSRWESRIYFNKDGDYQLSITGEDLAGNAMEDLVYAEGTQAALDFTVDKTAPVLSVSYDNNTANHEFYYKEGRRAEISIEEKNFRSDLVDYSVLKDGGREAHGSALSSFSGGEGRGVSDLHHQASISYEEDGDYQFNIRVKDLAGNEALAYPEDHFVIDRTAPSLTISDILNESANKGEVSPKISYGDRYLDQDALSLKLIGEVHGEHELSHQQGGSISIARTDALNLPMQKSMEETESPKQKQEEKEGIVYQSSAGREEGNLSFQNFPEEPEADDVYRLSVKIVDMAGNETTEELWFSVNRFGSTYLLSDRAKALQGTYQKEGEEILISEINADEVLSSALTLYRNEEKHALSEGAEYQTTRSGGNGKWYRGDYLIKKDNFDKEGLYHLQISSQDKAGNLASTEQTERGAELRFGIDRTAPRILLSNVDDQGVYRGDVLDLDLSVQDNLWLEQVDATVDGEHEISWTDKSLQEAVAKDSFPLQISGEKGKRHKLLVVARDAAGNESRKEVSDFVITNNPLLRLISQKNFARNAAIATVAGLMGLSCVVNGPSLLQELKRRRLKGKRR
ncbi:Ig-like domain repeat protein [Oribacterium sinus]|nr:Ig-like domain repeat protein [Oribacterium sinus]